MRDVAQFEKWLGVGNGQWQRPPGPFGFIQMLSKTIRSTLQRKNRWKYKKLDVVVILHNSCLGHCFYTMNP
jgi:hypothetical protein